MGVFPIGCQCIPGYLCKSNNTDDEKVGFTWKHSDYSLIIALSKWENLENSNRYKMLTLNLFCAYCQSVTGGIIKAML